MRFYLFTRNEKVGQSICSSPVCIFVPDVLFYDGREAASMELNREKILQKLKKARKMTFRRNVVAEKFPLPPESEKKHVQIQMNRFIFPVCGKKEIYFAKNGRAVRQIFVPGELLQIPACAWSRELATCSHRMISIVLLRNFLRIVYIENGAEPHFTQKKTIYHAAHPLNQAGLEIFSAMQYLQEESPAVNDLFHAFLEVVLEQLENEGPSVGGKEQLTWECVRDYTGNNFFNEIDRESIAKAVRLHPAHISRIFKKYARCGVSEYITSLRMEHAKLLLASPEISIGEIADLCGYSSANYFIRVFRSNTLLTPMKYRERLLKDDTKTTAPSEC